MSVIEQELLEKLLLLDEPAQQRLMHLAEQRRQQRTQQWQAWFADVEQLKAKLRQDYPNGIGVSVLELLEESREDDEA